MARKKVESTESAPEVQQENVEIINEPKSTTYVVVRDGYRVSEKEYQTPDDPVAIQEKEFWFTVEKNHSHGAPVDIVQYESKKHRIW